VGQGGALSFFCVLQQTTCRTDGQGKIFTAEPGQIANL